MTAHDDTTQPDAHHDAAACGACPRRRDDDQSSTLQELSRRDFVSIAMLSSIAATLAACGGGDLSAADKLLAPTQATDTTATGTTTGTSGTLTVGANQFGVTVANYAALASVGGVAVVHTSPPIALARTSTGFVAYSLRCPHAGTTVSVLTNNTLYCPNHGATFASTGAWTGGYRTASLSARTVTVSSDNSFVVVNLT